MIRKYLHKFQTKLGLKKSYRSETAKVRDLVLPYCTGYGCDVGFGGDKIKKDAVGIDLPSPYASVGSDPIDIACNVITDPIPVEDSSFDYVYTSHLIEDFEDTLKGLNEFIRILKSGGNLILVFPDQQVYEWYCKRTGQPLNAYHKHADMGLAYMKKILERANVKRFEILKEMDRVVDYNVVLVTRIYK